MYKYKHIQIHIYIYIYIYTRRKRPRSGACEEDGAEALHQRSGRRPAQADHDPPFGKAEVPRVPGTTELTKRVFKKCLSGEKWLQGQYVVNMGVFKKQMSD